MNSWVVKCREKKADGSSGWHWDNYFEGHSDDNQVGSRGTLLTIFTNIFAASLNHDIIVLKNCGVRLAILQFQKIGRSHGRRLEKFEIGSGSGARS